MAISLRLAGPPTDDEIVALAERNPGYQFERTAAGELVVTPNGGSSGRHEVLLVTQLHVWAESEGSGLAFSPSTGFRLRDGSLLCPDASWVRRDRWQALTKAQRDGLVPFCPDAVFEIASQSDSLRALQRKMQAYLSNGAQLAVLIDPERRAVEISTTDRDPQVLESVQSVSLDPVLPGFTLDLRGIFE